MAGPLVITWQDVVNIAPEFANPAVPGPAQTAILEMVTEQVPVEPWGSRQAAGQANLAAHLATIRSRSGKGPTIEQTTGPISRQYSDLLQFGPLGTTSYGLEYQRLIRTLPNIAMGLVC